MENIFDTLANTKSVLRELRLLRHFSHENVVGLRRAFVSSSRDAFQDIYLVTEAFPSDLAAVLESSAPLSADHIQFIIYQVLRGCKYIHSCRVIHRELRPRCLLMNEECELVISDFSVAQVTEVFKCQPIDKVCTRWYRAPEALGSVADLTTGMDIWSIGCIFSEMLAGKPLLPSESIRGHIRLIVDLLGPPALNEFPQATLSKCGLTAEAATPKGRSLDIVLNNVPTAAFDLAKRMLAWDAERRITAWDTLRHPYIQSLHCEEDEPVMEEELNLDDFEFEVRCITIEFLRQEICREVKLYSQALEPEPDTPPVQAAMSFRRYGERLH